jgi:hypothetical protein
MRCPQQVHFVPAAVCPVVEKVVHEKSHDPDGWVFKVPFKCSDLVNHQGVNKDGHQFQNGTNRLTDEANVQTGDRIVEAVNLLRISFGDDIFKRYAAKKKGYCVKNKAHMNMDPGNFFSTHADGKLSAWLVMSLKDLRQQECRLTDKSSSERL